MPPWQGGGDMILSVSFGKTTYNALPYKFEAGTPNISGAIGLGAAVDFLRVLDRHAAHAHEQALLGMRTATLGAIRGATHHRHGAATKASLVSFVVEGVHPHDLGTILDEDGIAVRTGHHCAMPVMEFFKLPATARASLRLLQHVRGNRPARRGRRARAHAVRLTAAAMELNDLYRDVILDHNRRPRNFGPLDRPTPAPRDSIRCAATA